MLVKMEKKYNDIDEKNERRQKLWWLGSLTAGAVMAVLVGALLERFLPTFGEFWQMMVFIPAWCLFSEFVVWLFLPRRYQREGRWKSFLRALLAQYVLYVLIVGVICLFNDPVQSASRMFLIIQFIKLPNTIYQQRKEMREAELRAMRKDEDLYELAMKQMESAPNAPI